MSKKVQSIAAAALVIMFMNLASKLLGFVRETVIAREYGATFLTDAYNAAYTIPYFLQMVLGMALVTSIVPVVAERLLRGEEKEAWRIASITLNWTVLIMAVFTLLGMLGAGALVNLITPGFPRETADLTVFLTVIMFPSVVFMGAGMLFTGVLNAKKRFAVAAFAPGFSNLIIIISVLFLGHYGVHYLAWGTLAGMVGAMLIQAPVLKRAGFHYTWSWELRHPEVRGLFLNLLPIFVGTAVNQIYLAINRYFASGLAEGSISALNYAGKLMNLPVGIFALAVSSAIFPTLAEQAVRGDTRVLAHTLNRGLKLVLLIALPAAAGLMALDTPIVKLLFERGAFDTGATGMTADALFYLAAGMFAVSANMVITRAYYALRDVSTPLIIGLLSIAVNVLVSLALADEMGHSGLALANTVATVFAAVFMYILLRRRLPRLYFGDLFSSAVKALLASILTGFSALAAYRYLVGSLLTAPDGMTLLGGVAVAILAGMLVYGIALLILREGEAISLLKTIRTKTVR